MNFYLIGLVSLLLGLVLSFGVLKLFPLLGWMDNPKKYNHDREAIPYSVGFVFLLLFLVLNLFFLGISRQLILLDLVLLGLGVFSFVDDRKGISPVLRFVLQIFFAGAVVWSGVQVVELTNPFGPDNLKLLWLAPVLSVFWIVLLTNLLNFLDGVSGLTSGVSSIGFMVLFFLSIWPGMHTTDQTMVSVMALILAVLAGLAAVFEFPKPKFLIGDSGTMFFGFMLGVLTLLNGAKLATVALVLFIPILDGIMVIVKRVLDGKKPWQGDLSHTHHRLLDLGFSKRKLILGYYALTMVFGVLALFAWNTFFKVISLLILGTGFLIFIKYLWIQEKK